MALLLPDGTVVDEHGATLDLDRWPKGTRLWASYDTVYRLVRDGQGEALTWRGEEIRWRHRRFEEEWVRRASDANVVRLPLGNWSVAQQLRAFAAWRDWLASYGASPAGTTGSAAMSLLKATLERRLYTSSGERPPLAFTLGGRQELHRAGDHQGRLEHLDLPAAYASTLAGLRYGGVWLRHDPASRGRDLFRHAGGATPCFVRARVRVPELVYGPLVRRPRGAPGSFLASQLAGSYYPVGRVVQGVWTYEELLAAEGAGCRILTVLDGWLHRSGWQPFAPWWEAIEAGRALGGLAGTLAKLTGNALWGRFALEPGRGVRAIRSYDRRARRTVSRPVDGHGRQFAAHDLAETVSGRVRGRLFGAMLAAGERLVLADTDGLWRSDVRREDRDRRRCEPDDGEALDRGTGEVPPEGSASLGNVPARQGRRDGAFVGRSSASDQDARGWRVKDVARRLQVIHTQRYRYQLAARDEWRYCVAGVPVEEAPEAFQRAWDAALQSREGMEL